MPWNYNRKESTFAQVPVGKHRIRVYSAELKESSKGNQMVALQFEVSGMNTILYHYITYLPNNPDITDRMLTQFYDSFPAIAEGDQNLQNWVGKVGACNVAVDKNDESRTRLSSFIPANRQDDLPPWKEPSGNIGGVRATQVVDDELPFM